MTRREWVVTFDAVLRESAKLGQTKGVDCKIMYQHMLAQTRGVGCKLHAGSGL